MKIRRIAIGFALFSAIYWLIVEFIAVAVIEMGLAFIPHWEVALVTMLPGMIYAIICLIFCHRLARRVMRAALKDKEAR